MEYSLLFICLCLVVRLCLKMGYEYRVLVRLLQIGPTDLTVCAICKVSGVICHVSLFDSPGIARAVL